MVDSQSGFTATDINSNMPIVDLAPKPPYERMILRTPSPTPSEQLALSGTRLQHLKNMFRKKNFSRGYCMGGAEYRVLIVVIRMGPGHFGIHYADDTTGRVQGRYNPCITACRNMDA
jgi:hypothetical protein